MLIILAKPSRGFYREIHSVTAPAAQSCLETGAYLRLISSTACVFILTAASSSSSPLFPSRRISLREHASSFLSRSPAADTTLLGFTYSPSELSSFCCIKSQELSFIL